MLPARDLHSVFTCNWQDIQRQNSLRYFKILRSKWLLYVPPGLTLKNSLFRIFMFSGAFAKLQKAIICFVMSTVRMEQLDCQ